MLREERLAGIKKYIEEQNRVRLQEIVEMFSISPVTARKDLAILEERGYIKLVRGGAVWNGDDAATQISRTRRVMNMREKQQLVSCLDGMISDGQTVFMNGGTTTVEAARYLAANYNRLTVVTNNLGAVGILRENGGFRVMVPGGMYWRDEDTIVGRQAEEDIKKYNADIALIAVNGVSVERGVTDFRIEECGIIRTMIQNARKAAVLADHSKFGRIAPINVCPLDDISCIVTDEGVENETVREYRRAEVRLVFRRSAEDPVRSGEADTGGSGGDGGKSCDGTAMIQEERFERIVDHLKANGTASLGKLASLTHMSVDTVRRDLDVLAGYGVLEKVRGGAVWRQENLDRQIYGMRNTMNTEEKQELAQNVDRVVREGRTVAIGGGSTTVCLARVLCEKYKKLTVITNDLDIVKILSSCEHFTMLIPGGVLDAEENILYGQGCEEEILKYNADVGILAVNSLSLEKGVTDFRYNQLDVLKAIFEIADTRVIAADHSKFERPAGVVKICDMKDVDIILSDSGLDEGMKRKYEDRGVRIIRAEQA